MKKTRNGFSLAEMIIASAIVCVVMIAIVSVQSFVLRAQQKQSRMRKISGEAMYSVESIKSAMRSASVIARPAAGVTDAWLLAYVNVIPEATAGSDSRIMPSVPQTYFLYCFQDTTGTLYKYSNVYPVPASFFPFVCGNPARGSQKREVVISGSDTSSTYSFTRYSDNSNTVNIDYSFSYRGEKLNGHTAVSVQKSL